MLNVNMLRRAFHIVVIHAVGRVARHFYLAVGIMRRVFEAAAASPILKRRAAGTAAVFCRLSPDFYLTAAAHIVLVVNAVFYTAS